MIKTGKYKGIFLLLAALLIGTLVAAICIGRYSLTISEVFKILFNIGEIEKTKTIVVWSVRFPRTVMAMMVGACLSCVGVCLQAMFANPLVSSHILGVSYSSGFGAALGILLSSNFLVIQGFAMLFGFVGMALTYLMSRKNRTSSTIMLVLSGTIVGAVFEALTSFIKYIADPEEKLPAITYWLMGSLAGSSMADVLKVVPIIGIAILVLWLIRWRLNVVSLREDEAASLGVNVKNTRIIVILATTVIVAISVSFCGVISFVGLAVPHLARMIVGNDHKYLLPASILMGGSFLVIIDTVARSLTASEIPLSILTALVGAPVFAILLHKTGGGWSD
ncbi:MAG: iron ABC transporter permease [Lachnospiraceae bacterium]|nr:iron ABC transporter permease [Lachnospiraceae bacterium]